MIADLFDEYGEREWQRHDLTPAGRVSFNLHRHYLKQFVSNGDLVLDVGAGPGRFTIELAKLGAQVFVGDTSQQQLVLNQQHLQDAGLEASVAERAPLDVTDLSRFGDATFDAVVCYGSPLSWVLEDVDRLRLRMAVALLMVPVPKPVSTQRVRCPGPR